MRSEILTGLEFEAQRNAKRGVSIQTKDFEIQIKIRGKKFEEMDNGKCAAKRRR